MSLLLDTNTLLYLTKDATFQQKTKVINPDGQKNFASVTTIGELKSIALQNSWAHRRLQNLYDVLSRVIITEVNENLYSSIVNRCFFSTQKSLNQPLFLHHPKKHEKKRSVDFRNCCIARLEINNNRCGF